MLDRSSYRRYPVLGRLISKSQVDLKVMKDGNVSCSINDAKKKKSLASENNWKLEVEIAVEISKI